MRGISCIICAFNEQSTIENVIKITSGSNLFDQIIVVNDGSTDQTGRKINELKKLYNIIDIHLPENKGKGYAMAIGIEKANFEILVFCDTDLSELKIEHFLQLVKPVMENKADMVLGQVTENTINYKTGSFYRKARACNNMFKSFTGERALLRKDILPILKDMRSSKFGVETLINLYYQSREKRIKYVQLVNLKHPTKFEKTNQLQAIKEFALEGYQIAFTAFNNLNLIKKVIINNFHKL